MCRNCVNIRPGCGFLSQKDRGMVGLFVYVWQRCRRWHHVAPIATGVKQMVLNSSMKATLEHPHTPCCSLGRAASIPYFESITSSQPGNWPDSGPANNHPVITGSCACVSTSVHCSHASLSCDQCIYCLSPIICMPFSLFIGLFPPQRNRKVRATCL